jgi:hypothetical protein
MLLLRMKTDRARSGRSKGVGAGQDINLITAQPGVINNPN